MLIRPEEGGGGQLVRQGGEGGGGFLGTGQPIADGVPDTTVQSLLINVFLLAVREFTALH